MIDRDGIEPTEEQLASIRSMPGHGDGGSAGQSGGMTRFSCERDDCEWFTTNLTPMMMSRRPDREVAIDLIVHDLEHQEADRTAAMTDEQVQAELVEHAKGTTR